MKLTTLFESKDKKPNPMAKALSDPKFKPKTEKDKKKEAKKGYQKHKGKVEEAGYQGEVEPTHHDFRNVNLDSIKKIIADRNLKADAEEVDGAIRVHTYDADRKSVAKSLGINEDEVESVDPIRHDQDAKEELAKEIYANNEYYQSEYEDWEAFMNSDDFEEENMRLWSKFGESKIKPYVSMYTDDETGKMWYDVLDSDGKSAFKTKDKKAAMGFFNKNFDALRKGFASMKEFDGPDETQDNAGFSDKEIKMAFGVLNDPKFKGGNYSGAVNVINKIAPGLADHPSVANALKRANENLTEDQMTDEVKAILDKHGIKSTDDIEYGGEAFSDLFDYFSSDPDEMPYGVQKARTGMPDEWIANRILDLGLLKEVDGVTEPTQSTTPQKGPDDTRLQTNVSLQQIANLFPGVEDKQGLLQSLLRLKQGQKISMKHAYTLADAFKELISKDPQDTQRAMIQLKKINAQTENKDDAPGYPYQNKTMNQGKTPEQALKDERTDDSEELFRVKQLAGLLRASEE